MSTLEIHCHELEIPSGWVGKSGGELLSAVKATHSPASYVNRLDGPDGMWELLKITDSTADHTGYMNLFSDERIDYGHDGGAPANMEVLSVADVSWWRITSHSYSKVSWDLYNIFVAPTGTLLRKSDFPPGVVEVSRWDNGVWRIGSGIVGPVKISMWEPPCEMCGDVARSMMYLAVVYGDGILRYESCGGAVWADDIDDAFTAAYAAQLLVWHRMDPPSGYERSRNEVFSESQGNRNPFVDYPDLAEYLWGKYKGEILYGGQPSYPEEVIPLKGEYSIDEPRINLVSDMVPDGSRWEIDGVDVVDKYLVPSEIGAGIHELKFYGSTLCGAIKIMIK